MKVTLLAFTGEKMEEGKHVVTDIGGKGWHVAGMMLRA